MSEKPNMLFLDGEEASDKLKRKSKDSPFMIAGKIFNFQVFTPKN